jgi:hypothetical protein
MSPRRVDPKKKEKPASGLPTWAIATGIGGLVVVAVVALFMLQTPSAPPPSATGGSTTAGSRTTGNPNARFELVEWSDFQ